MVLMAASQQAMGHLQLSLWKMTPFYSIHTARASRAFVVPGGEGLVKATNYTRFSNFFF